MYYGDLVAKRKKKIMYYGDKSVIRAGLVGDGSSLLYMGSAGAAQSLKVTQWLGAGLS